MGQDTSLKHYGTKRHSGRYPHGSGEDPQRSTAFLESVKKLKSQGLTEKQVAVGMGLSIKQMRAQNSIAKDQQKQGNVSMAVRLKDKGYSNTAIGDKMGINESSVRALLKPASQMRANATEEVANILKSEVIKKDYLDVGVGVERHLGISRTKLNTAIEKLETEEGYTKHWIKVEQLGTGKATTITVLAKPGVEYSEVYSNKDKVRVMGSAIIDPDGRTSLGVIKPRSLSSDKVFIKYAENGEAPKDGVIEIRRNVPELDLGHARYAQVRVAVDGTHYMKGMAIYSDDMPKGYDVIYNTAKAKGTPKEKVYKEMKVDEDNPFGTTVKQKEYIRNGKKETSALNIVYEEGEWSEWSKSISTQVLSKQPTALAKKQLGLAFDTKKAEFDEIMSLTNPTVKKKLLQAFSDDADSSAVHLKAAALPRQGSHVILPFPGMKDTEIYAPNYRDGERVVLIRYPHGGKFEIPELTVNNKYAEARKYIKNAKDAVGINHKVAERMSGADFDGDTVLVIPNNSKSGIKTSPALTQLKGFNPQEVYRGYEGMPELKTRQKNKLMGDVSNLVTDMTIKGASNTEIARAVRHSMVVIDAEKHNLNYKQSHIDNGIAALKTKYQGGPTKGAATLISRASSEQRVPHRVEGEWQLSKRGIRKRIFIDPKTGAKLYGYTGESYVDEKGRVIEKTSKSTKLYEAKDAAILSSGTPMEREYVTHANKLKALANEARREYLNTPKLEYSPAAKQTYSKEVESLNSKLNVALKNAPLERQAQLFANNIVSIKKQEDPNMDADTLKKKKGQALVEARRRVGASKTSVDVSPNEWAAIQAGAISDTKLSQILANTNIDRVKALATPRLSRQLTSIQETRIKTYLNSGHTQSEVADLLGISANTVANVGN